tara:strand:- start:5147 stop:6886 length:1740 start_codon:yes stop_codon:yes gene_type:complete
MSALEKLTEGIIARDLGKEGAALLNKWEKTGLLEGLDCDVKKNNMARLLENQAKELLREASTMAGGDVEGFSAVAFPIVRRVFGELIANDLVSVQPMSLPSGLIFFMDFTTQAPKLGYSAAESLYGGGVVASQLTSGMILSGIIGNASSGPYALNNGYASPTGTITATTTLICSGVYGGTDAANFMGGGTYRGVTVTSEVADRLLRYDSDIPSGSSFAIASLSTSDLNTALFDMDNLIALSLTASMVNGELQRRLTRIDPDVTDTVLVVVAAATGSGAPVTARLGDELDSIGVFAGPVQDRWEMGSALGSVRGNSTAPGWNLENTTQIPEINIQVDSVAVTALTKKLKAKWTPELGQDLNAYHNLDAEVELTSILSEQIALEIDQEILNDLIQGAAKGAGVRYWSRSAGKFVNRATGGEIGSDGTPDFTGTVSEWYETCIETINDVSAQIHRKTVRGGANFIVCSPDVANILEFTAGYRANVAVDSNKGTAGAMNVGSISKKFDIFVDPYFPRNVILVGRKGNSFLESGYVYAPYVPLQVTPTIFGTEDFVPRKGVMTRYGKKMVRPDMYGLVIVEDLV